MGSVSVLRPFAIEHRDTFLTSPLTAAPLSATQWSNGAASGAEAEHDKRLGHRIELNSAYYDAMLSLLPARAYFIEKRGGERAGEEKGGNKFFKNALGNSSTVKAQHKVSRGDKKRVRFETAAKTVPELLEAKGDARSDDEDDDDSDDGADAAPTTNGVSGHKRKRSSSGDGGAAESASLPVVSRKPGGSIDDLRARLQAKIAEMRTSRKSTAYNPAAEEEDVEMVEKEEPVGSKKKQRLENEKDKKAAKKAKDAKKRAAKSKEGDDAEPAAEAPAAKRPRQDKGAGATAEEELDLDFAFAGVAPAAASVDGSTASAEKTLNKRARLKKMLKEAEKTQRKLEKLAADGNVKAKTDSQFERAMKRAEGHKVMDDPKLIAKSLKKMEKGKAKSSEKWAARTAQVSTAKAERAQERNDNIKNKKFRSQIQTAARAEAQKAAAREAKKGGGPDSALGAPMTKGGSGSGGNKHRAGFEGRAGKSFINKK